MPENPYMFGDPATDRHRLETQTRLFSNFIRANAVRLVGKGIKNILDVGCGEGQLDAVLHEIYPQARLVAIDKDERAIIHARKQAQELGLEDVEFLVGDVTQGLPAGPFDLVYNSLVLLHLREPAQVIQAVYQVLQPGGYIWIKDLHPTWATAMNHRSYRRLADLTASLMETIGAHPFLLNELPHLLTAAGFVDIRQELEEYPLGGATPEGQAFLATQLGVFYNARAMMSKLHKVPESEIERLYLDVCNAALRSTKEVGTESVANLIARRPIK
jgi:2-polyprenyl-3-methyl-5-hydroxy-6-metoxy-1,4-benzoquinol methylase